MYAVVNTGGKQAKVEVGTIVAVEKLNDEVGATVSLPVMFIADGDRVLATPAEIAGATVTAEVLEHFKGEKQIVFKFKKRKGYKRKTGHRQSLTAVRILDITAGDGSKPAKKVADKPAKAEEKPAKAADEKPAKKAEKAPVAEPASAAPVAEEAPETCAALKADGIRCQNKPKEGSKYCGVHAKKYEG
ncbi:MAG TPA: 50S ribosomal protein L21 [Actinobacteria bacterium]|nr:50S ribosomal protein L21 [Actinomycetota bacterium]